VIFIERNQAPVAVEPGTAVRLVNDDEPREAVVPRCCPCCGAEYEGDAFVWTTDGELLVADCPGTCGAHFAVIGGWSPDLEDPA
jgi:hypothetical protein